MHLLKQLGLVNLEEDCAVVADEVRKLADQSGEYANQVSQIIKDLLVDTKEADGVMQETNKQDYQSSTENISASADQQLPMLENFNETTFSLKKMMEQLDELVQDISKKEESRRSA